ncbi:hypothetical protein [Streptomyces shaanxiensis]|uniref:Uncharacterized protein n=1 Tax=Streptomyces shaanxiensis TaxID=653357 RepID=A0ABP7WJY5_9ACTN
MEAIIASAIAVLGTLLGSGITLAFQQRAADRNHDFTLNERLRQERLDTFSAYAGALINYRRCLILLWFCLNEQPPPDYAEEVRDRAYDLRARAQEAMLRVVLLTDDESLSEAARTILDDIACLYRADSREEFDHRRSETGNSIGRLISNSKQHL